MCFKQGLQRSSGAMSPHPCGIEWCGKGARSWYRLLGAIATSSVPQMRAAPGPQHPRQVSAARPKPKMPGKQMMRRHVIPAPRKATLSHTVERGLGWRVGLLGLPLQATRKRLCTSLVESLGRIVPGRRWIPSQPTSCPRRGSTESTRCPCTPVWKPRSAAARHCGIPVSACAHHSVPGASITVRWLYCLVVRSLRQHCDRRHRSGPGQREKHEEPRSSRTRKISDTR